MTLNGLMKIPGNVNTAELQLGAISPQITWKAVGRSFLPGPGGHRNTTGGSEFNTTIKQPFLFSQEKCGGWKDGRLHRFILLHAELPLPRSIFYGRLAGLSL